MKTKYIKATGLYVVGVGGLCGYIALVAWNAWFLVPLLVIAAAATIKMIAEEL